MEDVWYCPECGYVNMDGSMICVECGLSLFEIDDDYDTYNDYDYYYEEGY